MDECKPLPPGSRLAREAFGDDGERWGAAHSKASGSGGGGLEGSGDHYDYYGEFDGGGGAGSGGGGSGGRGSVVKHDSDGATVLVYGGYDGSRGVWGGTEVLLLRVSNDGSRVRWGRAEIGRCRLT